MRASDGKDLSSSRKSASHLPDRYHPRLLLETEPAHRVFLRNLRDPIFPHGVLPPADLGEQPAFWSDVFVSSGLPWHRFAESFAIHMLVIAGLWGASRAWLLRPRTFPPRVFSKRDVIYFPASEYLPPLDTGNEIAYNPQRGDPEFSKQTILSVPPEADNPTQTVVTPPDVKLKNEILLPNVVAWNSVSPAIVISAVSRRELPAQPPTAMVAPPPTIEPAADRRRRDAPENTVIAPPPEVSVASLHMVVTPQAAIIEPPPTIRGHIPNLGVINIGHSEAVPPAPQLPTGEQRTLAYRAEAAAANLPFGIVPPPPSLRSAGLSELGSRAGVRSSTDIVPPPPSVSSDHSKNRIVALGVRPVAGAPPMAVGNRRGTFALSPRGKPGAAGTPDTTASGHGSSRSGGEGRSSLRSDLPPGLVVKAGSESSPLAGESEGKSTTSEALVAEAKPPLRVSPTRRAMVSTSPPTSEEREVFGDRKFYSMILNMPNLNSAGGSWVIRFAELKNSTEQGDLTAPEATRKVDPAYPLELMRTQIEGKVTLYAVIRRDGTVGDVRVLNSVDDRLDAYARVALSRWRFRPATKAGSAVDLEAVVTIPFRAHRAF
jgi:TonB family protein